MSRNTILGDEDSECAKVRASPKLEHRKTPINLVVVNSKEPFNKNKIKDLNEATFPQKFKVAKYHMTIFPPKFTIDFASKHNLS